ncbi:uncharacterized protein LOC111197182 [Astyanax mexicanus]|uniref:uncharacterized protein LOC111197182 n=1 Tax=Astyanax mexicanus TaxID=7994 RepID=UPI0020CAC55B|nr:uncharacterized protein LOC111197182 [Astyanax mexicanus]
MDSTKKIVKKLAGDTAGTAAWATNVRKEHGQVLTTVLTSHEGTGLVDMASSLMKRYRDAMDPPPRVIYMDRDCCSLTGSSSVAKLFHEWEDVTIVRLDVWYLMRWFASPVTTESHQLYGAFMSGLSGCIFVWEAGDVTRLREAKRLFGLSDDQVELRITKKELAKHCRSRTRGAEETTWLIRQLTDTFKGHKGSDTMGIPLLDRGRIEAVWQSQKRHLICIQDLDEEQLYTKVRQLVKGGVTLPVYHCARGSTSLESFHLHLNNFIQGTSANGMHLQVYLLEGLVRWNENRAIAAIKGEKAARDRSHCRH